MTAEARQTYRERIADPATPEGLRKYYAKLMREPDTVIPDGFHSHTKPSTFIPIHHDHTTPDTDHPTHPPLQK